MAKGDKKFDSSVDDCCLFCGKHPSWGGHHFEGVENEYGDCVVLDGDDEWIVIEHIVGCYVWFCTRCKVFYEQGRKQAWY